MRGKRHTPTQASEICLLREAGYSLAAIAEQVELSPTTVSRILGKHGVKRAAIQEELVGQARQSLLQQFKDDEHLNRLHIELRADLVAQVKRSREIAALALDNLQPNDTATAALTFRALAAHATAVKAHVDSIEKLLPATSDPEDLPALTFREMTPEEEQEIRRQQELETELCGGQS